MTKINTHKYSQLDVINMLSLKKIPSVYVSISYGRHGIPAYKNNNGYDFEYRNYEYDSDFDFQSGFEPIPLEEALEKKKDAPNGLFKLCCNILDDLDDVGYHGNIGEITRSFSEAHIIKINIDNLLDQINSTVSMEGSENLRNVKYILFTIRNSKVKPNHPLICLNGIEFCHSLKHLSCCNMNISSLAPLMHLELISLNISNNPINDLSMIRTKELQIDEHQLELVKSAFSSSIFRVRYIIVNFKVDKYERYGYGNNNFSMKYIKHLDNHPDFLHMLHDIQNELKKHIAATMKSEEMSVSEEPEYEVNVGRVLLQENRRHKEGFFYFNELDEIRKKCDWENERIEIKDLFY
jgi:hypothetical protein